MPLEKKNDAGKIDEVILDSPKIPEGCEVRACAGIELRDGEGGPVIAGYAAVFDRLSVDLGGFREQIAPGAFTETLKSGNDVRSLVNHDSNQRLARSSNGTVRLKEDKQGLNTEIDPPNTTIGRDTTEDVRSGLLDGMSFMFRTLDDKWETKDGEELRTLLKVELLEVGPVTFPAYPDTTVALRSLDQRNIKKEEPSEDVSEDTPASPEEISKRVEKIDRRTKSTENLETYLNIHRRK